MGHNHRIHLYTTERARDDLDVIDGWTSAGPSKNVAAAVRCFRRAMELGIVTEAGELLLRDGDVPPILNIVRDSATGRTTSAATRGAT